MKTDHLSCHFPYQRLLLGVTASIAAYKSADLVRQLSQRGVEVQVVMTPDATAMMSPMTLQALSGHPVRTEHMDPHAEAAMSHIELARWADAVLVAPATADAIAHLAHGLANQLLYALCLVSRAPVWIAPAMNGYMWDHPATRDNVSCLQARGVRCLGPAHGEQACGDVGWGRMLAVEDIIAHMAAELTVDTALSGCRVLITAGPTHEPIDPIRYIGNHSSGQTGYAIATACARAGAEVTLISGPVTLPCPAGVRLQRVRTSKDMYEAVLASYSHCDVFIAAGAVTDYRPIDPASQKIKRQQTHWDLSLVANEDIVKTVTAQPDKPFVIGFAAETERLIQHARQKMIDKRLDAVVANLISTTAASSGFTQLEARLLTAERDQLLPNQSKQQLADALVTYLSSVYVHQEV